MTRFRLAGVGSCGGWPRLTLMRPNRPAPVRQASTGAPSAGVSGSGFRLRGGWQGALGCRCQWGDVRALATPEQLPRRPVQHLTETGRAIGRGVSVHQGFPLPLATAPLVGRLACGAELSTGLFVGLQPHDQRGHRWAHRQARFVAAYSGALLRGLPVDYLHHPPDGPDGWHMRSQIENLTIIAKSTGYRGG